MSKHSYETHPHLYVQQTVQTGAVSITKVVYKGKTTKQEPRPFWMKDKPAKKAARKSSSTSSRQQEANALFAKHKGTRQQMLKIIAGELGCSEGYASTLYNNAKKAGC